MSTRCAFPGSVAGGPALAFLLLVAPARAQATDWSQELAHYQAWIVRPSLHKRTLARQQLAATLDPRAFELLVASYDKPEEPVDQNRYLIATITMDEFHGRVDEALLQAWRTRHDRPEDAWLWYETQRFTVKEQFDGLRQQVLGRLDPFLRAAALDALADGVARGYAPPGIAALCSELLAALPRKDLDRALLTEATGRVLLATRREARNEPWRAVTSALIDQLGDRATPARTKTTVSRQLARVFGCSNYGFQPELWRNELDKQAPAAVRNKWTVSFGGISTIGQRFVYVIDASDSMCKKVSDREKRSLGPVTGPPKPKPKGTGGYVPKESELDWNRIVTRFDVGREFVRQSLLNLDAEQQFAVLLFGDTGEFLAATPKLMPVTPKNVRAAIDELEAITPGPPAGARPDGVLRGRTNLHGAFQRAFEITRAGMSRHAEYVDPKTLLDGCDSIFLLSDGSPSWDDWPAEDRRDPEDQAGDPESHINFENQPKLLFQGPYAHPDGKLLLRDVERMNLFRNAEIHCVGIGEANANLLERLAGLGLGKALMIEGERR